MKLEQLRSLCTLVDEGMNMSRAAEVLHSSQPGISRQIKLLEEELKTTLLIRAVHRITGLTPAGVHVAEIARRILSDVDSITEFGRDFSFGRKQVLRLATTQLHTNYIFPPIIDRFRQQFREIELVFLNGEPKDIYEAVATAKADLGVTTLQPEENWHLLQIPCYELKRSLLVPLDHPILRQKQITLEDIARHPLITYSSTFAGGMAIARIFEKQGLRPNVSIRTMDTESIKKFVRLGLGIAIVHSVAIDVEQDKLLKTVDVTHLFGSAITNVIIRPTEQMPEHFWRFVELLGPAWNRAKINKAIQHMRQRVTDGEFV